ncbi:type III-B CRISPR-associated protein Cas10/Cmr2 [Halomonas sp.]|uniref:type III-B CRISPR-associated protein Cas10/Cmr2 n=1 Tax=Halomonas sp. TaxID=1486246 RepID=UPI00384FC92A
MSQTHKYFHLTLGPVQGFVAQARRTRDFWAGSFLLSWMAGVAMHAVQRQGGEVEFPEPDTGFLSAMLGKREGDWPEQGSLPNRFKALGAKVDETFLPGQAVEDVMQAWQALAELVWQADLEASLQAMGEAQYQRTRAIWERQISHFWEVSWVTTEDPIAADLLDRRKNWRSHWPAEEGGVTCMMMAAQQELSGADSPNAETLRSFWGPLRSNLRQGEFDLREGEVLSALAFIKRRFVRHFPEYRCRLGDGDKRTVDLKGWRLPSSVPSVMHLAASPWLQRQLAAARESSDVRLALVSQLERGSDALGRPEAESLLPGLRQAFENAGVPSELAGVDPSIFFSQVLENPRRFADADTLRLQSGLNALRIDSRLGEPAPFYAIVMMDGDSLGSQLSDSRKQQPISRALNQFTRTVPEIIKRQGGFLVYAGGDDVLAMLPVTVALSCAAELRQRYAACFAEEAKQAGVAITTSLSGAVLFCHIKRPLTGVLQDAHHVLDDIAKEKTGRDSLAVRVWQPGGIHLTWAQPWDVALGDDSSGENGLVIETLAAKLREQDDARLTNKFLFKVKALGERLPMSIDNVAHFDLVRALVRAELLHSGLELKRFGDAGLDHLVETLLRQALPVTRLADRPPEMWPRGSTINPDTFKLVRFLAREGRIER